MRFFINVFIMLLVLVFCVQASKLGEGRKQVGGTITFQSASGHLYENGDGDGQTSFGLSPFITAFIGAPGLAVGGELQFAYASQGDFSSSMWGIGPVVQYYIGADEDKDMYPYVSTSFIYSRTTFDDNNVDVIGTAISLAGGVLYFINDNVGVNAQVYYNLDSREVDVSGAEAVDGSVLGVEVGFSIFIDE